MGGLFPRRDALLREDIRHIERIFGPEITRFGGCAVKGVLILAGAKPAR